MIALLNNGALIYIKLILHVPMLPKSMPMLRGQLAMAVAHLSFISLGWESPTSALAAGS